jgi:hypothetical protein
MFGTTDDFEKVWADEREGSLKVMRLVVQSGRIRVEASQRAGGLARA